MENKNTLQITTQYPADRYNLLVPMQTIAEIADIQKPVINAVAISTDPKDREIYLQDKREGGWALTKKGLNKLMRAAGIKILNTRPIIPSVCQKCCEINRNIGRPVNCGSCGNEDVKFEARISVPQLTGQDIEFVAHKEIVVKDVTKGMTANQRAEFMKFKSEMCETKAINRALRAAMHIKGTYTINELRKPFVVAYLVPNLDNEIVKQEAVKHFFTSAQELYGGHNTSDRKAVFVADDIEGMAYEVGGEPIAEPENGAYRELPETAQEPPKRQEQPKAQQQPQMRNEAASNDISTCVECGAQCEDRVVNYSRQKYGRTLCWSCQNKYKGGKK